MEGLLLFENDSLMKIKSHKWEYEVKRIFDLRSALESVLVDGDIILIDQNVAKLYKQNLKTALNKHEYMLIEPTENLKSYQQIEKIIDWLIRVGFKKNNRLVAVGGGITQDICSFISSIMYRGVGWVFFPTNLLSQADSCIGSKTSINFGSYKNQVGNFHPPILILIDVSFLQTLSRMDFRSGMGEMMHYFIIAGREDMKRISIDYDMAFNNDDVLFDLIKRSLEIKKSLIEIDEFDLGPRNIFNYGHSFGHALESYTNYEIPHGIAVSFGMDIANQLSVALGLMIEKDAIEIRNVLQKNWWPCNFPEIDIDSFINLLSKDKKNIGKKFRFVLSKGPGNILIDTFDDNAMLREVLNERLEFYKNESSRFNSN